MQPYLLDIPGLAKRVAATRPSASHAALLTVLRAASPSLRAIKLVMTRGGIQLAKRQVLTAAGELIHDDHREFLRAELAGVGGNFDEVAKGLRPLDFRLSQCEATELFLVNDAGSGSPARFLQVAIDVERERVDRRFFKGYGLGDWVYIDSFESLYDEAESGDLVDEDDRRPTRPRSYRLRQVIDVDAFTRTGAQLDLEDRAADAGRVLNGPHTKFGPEVNGVPARYLTFVEPDTNLLRYAWRARRVVDDWEASSAGRSGARLSNHWVLDISNYTLIMIDQSLINIAPLWFSGTDEALFSTLEEIDRRVGIPFAWYFWMLPGSRVHQKAYDRALELADNGLLVLPEHDHDVLRRWSARKYEF